MTPAYRQPKNAVSRLGDPADPYRERARTAVEFGKSEDFDFPSVLIEVDEGSSIGRSICVGAQ
jgi:hypothetical protein